MFNKTAKTLRRKVYKIKGKKLSVFALLGFNKNFLAS